MLLALLLIYAPLARAQQVTAGTWGLNTFGGFTKVSPPSNLESGVGAGVRIGYFARPR